MSERHAEAPGGPEDEDDVFAALYGLPGTGALWGAATPTAFRDAAAGPDQERDRRNRHAELLRRWGLGAGLG